VTYSYSGNPANSQQDELRFLVGDTLSTDYQFSDEELSYLISSHGNVARAAIEACDGLIAKYARLVTQSVGAISISYSDRMKHYQILLARLKRNLCPIPYAGGISVDDMNGNNTDTDATQPAFSIGMHDRKGQ
jgi:hypothetical protein